MEVTFGLLLSGYCGSCHQQPSSVPSFLFFLLKRKEERVGQRRRHKVKKIWLKIIKLFSKSYLHCVSTFLFSFLFLFLLFSKRKRRKETRKKNTSTDPTCMPDVCFFYWSGLRLDRGYSVLVIRKWGRKGIRHPVFFLFGGYTFFLTFLSWP